MNRTNADLFALRERVVKELSRSKTPSIPLTIIRFVRYMHKIAPDLSNQQNIQLFKRFEMNLTYVLIPKLVENDLLARNILQIYRSLSKHAPLPPLRDIHSDEREYSSILNVKQFANEFYERKCDHSSSNSIITANVINDALLNSNQFASDDETIFFKDYKIADGGTQNNHALLKKIAKLKQWKRNIGMPAIAEVKKLQNMLEIYAEDANFQQRELKIVKSESSDMHSNLLRMRSSNEWMIKENNILRFTISNTQRLENDIQRSNQNRAKLQKLNIDLQIVNENYVSKNEELNNANDKNSGYIANLRQQLLECEQESAQELDFYIQSVVDLQIEIERLNKQIVHMADNNEWILQKNGRSISPGSTAMVIPDTISDFYPHTIRFVDKNKHFKYNSDYEFTSLNNAILPAVKVLSVGSESSFSIYDNVQFVSYDEYGMVGSNTNGSVTNTNAVSVIPCDDVKADRNQIVSPLQLKYLPSVRSGFSDIGNTFPSMNGLAKQKMKKELMLELRAEIREELRKEIASKVEENFQIKKQQMEIDAQIMQQDREKEYETNIAEFNLKWIEKTQILMNQLEETQRKYDQLLIKMNYNSNRKSCVNVDMEDKTEYCVDCLQQ